MYLSLNEEGNGFNKGQSHFTHKIKNYLKSEFQNSDYGQNVLCCIFAINCNIPDGYLIDFPTGAILHKKYTKSQNYLEFSFRLRYQDIEKANDEETLFLIEEGILKSFAEIGKMNIHNFDFESFYKDLQEVIKTRKWQNPDYVFREVPFPKELFKTKVKVPKMKEEAFWEIMKKSKETSKDSYDQVSKIEELLTALPSKEIIGFEHTLRLQMQKLNTFKVLALDTIMNNGTSDDGFLMFRFGIIQEGKDAFEKATKQTDTFDIDLKESHDSLLGAPDMAFKKKLGEDSEEELPSSVCDGAEIYEDMGMTGKDWDEKDLPKLFPKLWKRYRG